MMIEDIHHIQLAMPPGGEEVARAFYGGLLGLPEVAKPAELAGRGGVWFGRDAVHVHLGVETPFAPARKAHPAFRVASLADAVKACEAAGHPCRRDIDLPGLRRIYLDDPFGNRIELLELDGPA